MNHKHVTSLELSKKLKELGFPQRSLFFYDRLSDCPDGSEDWQIHEGKRYGFCSYKERYSTFLASELGEWLPKFYETSWGEEGDETWVCSHPDIMSDDNHWEKALTMPNAMAKMLIHLVEKGIINPKSL